jgi:NACHT domain
MPGPLLPARVTWRWSSAVSACLGVFAGCWWAWEALRLPPSGSDRLGVALTVAAVVSTASSGPLFWWAAREKTDADRPPVTSQRFKRSALRKYAKSLLLRYDKVTAPFIEREDQLPRTDTIYVPLQVLDQADSRRSDDIYERVRSVKRSVIVGPPGSGKSLLLRHSLLIWAREILDRPVNVRFWNRTAWRRDNYTIPVLVEIRLYRPSGGITGIINMIAEQFAGHDVLRARFRAGRALEAGEMCVLFDGLDEVAASDRKTVCDLLMSFATRYAECQMVVTCRTEVYQGQLSEKFAEVVRVADFDDAQINHFLQGWQTYPSAHGSDQLFELLHDAPRLMQLARNPLLLTLIAYIYAHRANGIRLPHSRAQFYKEAVDFLLRNKPELTYSQADKLAVLQRIALTAQVAPAAGIDRHVLGYAKVIETVRAVLPAIGLRKRDLHPLLHEITTRTGILSEVGGEQGFHFAHLTLQEFLAAAELADRPEELMQNYRDDPPGWREIVKLWCGYGKRDCGPVTSEVFSHDPVLALECLAEAGYVNESDAGEITAYFCKRLGTYSADDEVVVDSFGAVASDTRPWGQATLNFLTGIARTPSDARHATAVRALAASRLPRAVHVLSSLYIESRAARSALVSMGDLAVPALATHARNEQLTAIEDLAIIGTPAAAIELVNLLGTDSPIGRRAAQCVARLIEDPDIEEVLQASDDLVTPAGSRLDVVWEPFRRHPAGQLPEIMGRVAYLINSMPDGEAPDTIAIDHRVAVPLCAAEIIGRWREADYSSESELERRGGEPEKYDGGGKVAELFREILEMERDISHAVNRVSLKGLPGLPDDKFPQAAEEALARRSIRRVYRSLFAGLPTSLQRELLKRAISHYPDSFTRGTVNLKDWPDAFTEREEPRIARIVLRSLCSALSVAVAGLAIYGFIDILRGHWVWGPYWLAYVPIEIAGAIALAAFGLSRLGRRWQDAADGTAACAALIVISSVLLYAATAVRLYLGWLAILSATVITAIGLGMLAWIVSRRSWAAKNPLRGLLGIGTNADLSRTSIIAQGDSRAQR